MAYSLPSRTKPPVYPRAPHVEPAKPKDFTPTIFTNLVYGRLNRKFNTIGYVVPSQELFDVRIRKSHRSPDQYYITLALKPDTNRGRLLARLKSIGVDAKEYGPRGIDIKSTRIDISNHDLRALFQKPESQKYLTLKRADIANKVLPMDCSWP